MKLEFKRFMKRGQKGITLIELMVVMAILAVLSSIVFPAVSGTQEVSVDSQTKQDASTVANALSDYFADQTGAEVISSATTNVLTSATAQTKSSRWAEDFITVVYGDEFPPTGTTVSKVTITPLSGSAIVGTASSATDLVSFVNDRTAINLTTLVTSNYIPSVPKSITNMAEAATDIEFHNYLWLVEKTTAAGGGTDGSRQVEIYKLTTVTKIVGTSTTYELSYQQIY